MEINISSYTIVKFNMENIIMSVLDFYYIVHVPHGVTLYLSGSIFLIT